MGRSTGITRQASQSRHSELESLTSLFPGVFGQLGSFSPVGVADLPTSYATLLAHEDHMTVTLEAYHESLVRVEVVAERREPHAYARQSVLARHSDAAAVQYGLMRIGMSGLPANVRLAIETHAAPLGRILIKNNLLRHVELRALWRIEPGPLLRRHLQPEQNKAVYGRSAAIHLAGQRQVDLLEIVTDHPVAQDDPVI